MSSSSTFGEQTLDESISIVNARAEGREAYAEGLLYEFCSYPRDSVAREAWEDGWLHAEAESVASPIY